MLIKAVSHGKMYPIAVSDGNLQDAAVKFRGTSNKMQFMRSEYNQEGVLNNTPKQRQAIFMSAEFNAQFDVNVLSSAFNMDKAEFMGQLEMIDDWTTFDNDRFSIIRTYSDGLEEVTATELALMADVVAVVVDEDWFQVYDNENKMTEQYTASGLYWNYFYHVWKTISSSPFHNAVVFVNNTAMPSMPATLTFKVVDKDVSQEGTTTLVLLLDDSSAGLAPSEYKHIQTSDATTKGVAVHTYGGYIYPSAQTSITANVEAQGVQYTATLAKASDVGDSITFTKVV